MSIKHNEFGEVVSVNGLTTGHRLGKPMQDAIGNPEDNEPYATERNTKTRVKNVVEDEQPVPAGGGADWNQNDPTKSDYVKNRPFYTSDPALTNIFSKELSLDGEIDFFEPSTKLVLESGKTYTVRLNDVSFEVVAVSYPEYDCVVLGNMAINEIGEDTGEPFILMVFPDTSCEGMITVEYFIQTQQTTIQLNVDGIVAETHTIDPVYLPVATESAAGAVSYTQVKNMVRRDIPLPLRVGETTFGDWRTFVNSVAIPVVSFNHPVRANALYGNVLEYYNTVIGDKVFRVQVQFHALLCGGVEGIYLDFPANSEGECDYDAVLEKLGLTVCDTFLLAGNDVTNPKLFAISVDNSGNLTATEVQEE